jgi:hypothetical protein
MRDPRWAGHGYDTKSRETFEELTRCEIQLFVLHGESSSCARTTPGAAEWDRLERYIVGIVGIVSETDDDDMFLYILVQVVATRLRCTKNVRAGWELGDYLKLLRPRSVEAMPPTAVRPSMSLAALDLIHEFNTVLGTADQSVEEVELQLELHEHLLMTTAGAAESPGSCQPDGRFGLLEHARLGYPVDRANEENYMEGKLKCQNLLANYFMDLHGSWFERNRLLDALDVFEHISNSELRVLRSRDLTSPWFRIAKVSCERTS